MASTYSTNLKVELIGTGDQAGSWGTTTNGNLGTVLEEAIVGKATVNFPNDGDPGVTITMGNGPASSNARCIYLNLTSTTLTGTKTLTVPAIQKNYIIYNGTTGGQSITVTIGSGSTVTILNGKRALVYVDGSNGVVQQFTDVPSTTTIGGLDFATVTGSQTLTNKALTAPAINGGTVAQTVLTTPSLIEFGGAVYKNGSLSNPINTAASTTVTVDIPSNGATIGDYLVMSGATSVGGIPATEFNRVNVITGVAANSVTFTSTTTGTSAAGGGTVSYALLPKIVPPSVPTTLIGAGTTDTLTNKRITPRVNTVASGSTITPAGDTSDMYTVTALAVPATIAAPSGTPTNGQKLILRIKDDGTARALTWNSIYQTIGTLLPTTTTAGKLTYVGLVYNAQDTKWDVVAVTTQV